MAEEQSTQPEQQFEIQRIYLKDLSFESPNVPDIFTKNFNPEVGVELNTSHRALSNEGIFEVELNITLTVKSEGEVAYLVEIKEAGIFTATGYPDEQLAHLLAAYCPNIIYPFARELISEMAVRGGFPQQLLAPINFDALFAQHLQEQQQKAEAGTQEDEANTEAPADTKH
ncbi:MAG TPA: protein-export chaperone SecB [Gammaproteobacteria bacterium]|nr:protein-export chaperone SecB [Gammaproteobacteria bacterium]